MVKWSIRAVRTATCLIYPPACVLCYRRLDDEERSLCSACQSDLEASYEACGQCAAPQPAATWSSAKCPKCQGQDYRFSRALSLGTYDGRCKQIVLSMKKQAFEPLAVVMGRILAQRCFSLWPDWRPDVIIPVPMHWLRRWRRGINPAEVLSDELCREYRRRTGQRRIPRVDRGMQVRRNLKKQGTLGPSERINNVHGAFFYSRGYDLTGSRALIIDDVFTTGATASEAARAARNAGAIEVRVAVVARGGVLRRPGLIS